MLFNLNVAGGMTMIITMIVNMIAFPVTSIMHWFGINFRMMGMADFLDYSVETIVIISGVFHNTGSAISFLQGIAA